MPDPPQPADPIERFREVLSRASEREAFDATGMTLSTCGNDGRPSSRVVLLKGVDERGFIFYTNKQSRKAGDLRENAYAALCFYWPTIGEQIRVEGITSDVPDTEADAYFASRPRGSQLGAWASDQSNVIDSRDALLQRFHALEKQYDGKEVPRPPHWGGYILTPSLIEFWINGEYRLHDRFQYTRSGDSWIMQRLCP